MAEAAAGVAPPGTTAESRVQQLLDCVLQLTSGNFAARAQVSGAADDYDAIAVGLNWLAEEMDARENHLKELVAERTATLELTMRELQESEQRFLQLIEGLPLGVFVTEHSGKPLFVNAAAQKLLGQGVVPGVTVDRLAEVYSVYVAGTDQLYPTDRLPTVRALKGESVTVDDMELQVEGRRIPIEVMGQPVRTADGRVKYAIGVFRDVSERAALERERAQHAAELARSNAELEQFAYVASHDLQEPLRMVTSYCQLLQQRYQGRLDSDADEFIHFAVDGATRMQSLIQALLTYARVGSRGHVLQPTNCDDVLRQVLTDLERLIGETKTVVAREPLPTVMGDSGQLGQLFQNLIGNAIKFRGDHAPDIRISARRSGDEWVFSVSDNGIGIDPRYQERIFVIFQRLHTAAEYPGTGIGLSVCKKIIDRHGGRIWVDSSSGNGSTFHFTLKAVPET